MFKRQSGPFYTPVPSQRLKNTCRVNTGWLRQISMGATPKQGAAFLSPRCRRQEPRYQGYFWATARYEEDEDAYWLGACGCTG